MSNCPASEILHQRIIPPFVPPNDASEAICKLPAKIPVMAASDIQEIYGFTPGEVDEALAPLYYVVNQGGESSSASGASDCVENTDVGSDSFTWVDWLTPITNMEDNRDWILSGASLNCTDDGDLSDSAEFKRPTLPMTRFISSLPTPVTAPISIASARGGGGGGGTTVNGEEYKGFFKVIQSTEWDPNDNTAQVEVVDGANWYGDYCGYAVINEIKYDVKKDEVLVSVGENIVNYIYLSYLLHPDTAEGELTVPYFESATTVLNDIDILRVLLARVKVYKDSNEYKCEIVQEFTGAVLEYINTDGAAELGVLTSGPTDGYGPAVWKKIIVNADGTWEETGDEIPVVVPLLK